MRRRPIDVMTREQLEAMPTRSLLGRLRRLRECEESADGSDLDFAEVAALTGINFKADPLWSQAYDQVKAILDARERVPRTVERRSESLARRRKHEGSNRGRPRR